MNHIAIVILGLITLALIVALVMIVVSSRSAVHMREFATRIRMALNSSIQIREVLERTAIEVQQTLRVRHAFFYVRQDDEHFISGGTKRHPHVSPADIARLDRFVHVYGLDRLIQIDDIPKSDEIHRLLAGYTIMTVVPLVRGRVPIGYLFIGKTKKKSHARSHHTMLEYIYEEMAIIIENVMAVQEVRKLNASLQQRIEQATDELRSSNAQLRRLDEAKDEFLSLASHQLRTPLTSVKGYISMVLEGDVGKVSKEQRKLLAEAFTSSERMVHLINDFLNISRIQTGKFLIEKREVDLRRIAKQEVDALQTTAQSRDLTLKLIAPDEPIKLALDEGKIRQVIMNFIDNALYYSRPETTITVELKQSMQKVMLEVHDNGIGVPLKQQEKLFSKFFRADNAKRQRPDGTGVGLFLAKKVVDGHGGRIIFSSFEGKGSTFGFSLPKFPRP